jgi:hypothetical protein
LTDQYQNHVWVARRAFRRKLKKTITPRTHYRLVQKDAGYPLDQFRCTHELFQATLDVHKSEWRLVYLYTLSDFVFLAIVSARDKGILHRDVSLGNIILLPAHLWDHYEARFNVTSAQPEVGQLAGPSATAPIMEMAKDARTESSPCKESAFPYQSRRGLLSDWELMALISPKAKPRDYIRTVSLITEAKCLLN